MELAAGKFRMERFERLRSVALALRDYVCHSYRLAQ